MAILKAIPLASSAGIRVRAQSRIRYFHGARQCRRTQAGMFGFLTLGVFR